jgi:hypothetical protein
MYQYEGAAAGITGSDLHLVEMFYLVHFRWLVIDGGIIRNRSAIFLVDKLKWLYRLIRSHLQDSAIGVFENSEERLGPLPFCLGCHHTQGGNKKKDQRCI